MLLSSMLPTAGRASLVATRAYKPPGAESIGGGGRSLPPERPFPEAAAQLAVAPAPQPFVVEVDVARRGVPRARIAERADRLDENGETAGDKQGGVRGARPVARPVESEAQQDGEERHH